MVLNVSLAALVIWIHPPPSLQANLHHPRPAPPLLNQPPNRGAHPRLHPLSNPRHISIPLQRHLNHDPRVPPIVQNSPIQRSTRSSGHALHPDINAHHPLSQKDVAERRTKWVEVNKGARDGAGEDR